MEQEKTYVIFVFAAETCFEMLSDALRCLKELIAAKQELQGLRGARVIL